MIYIIQQSSLNWLWLIILTYHQNSISHWAVDSIHSPSSRVAYSMSDCCCIGNEYQDNTSIHFFDNYWKLRMEGVALSRIVYHYLHSWLVSVYIQKVFLNSVCQNQLNFQMCVDSKSFYTYLYYIIYWFWKSDTGSLIWSRNDYFRSNRSENLIIPGFGIVFWYGIF